MQYFYLFLTLAMLLSPSFKVSGDEHKEPFKVAILMFDGVQIIDFAAPYEVFGQAKFDVATVSVDGKSVTTAMGLNVSPDHSLKSLHAVDAIIVPGGDVRTIKQNKAVINWLNQQHPRVDAMLSVCTGSDIIAESGLLNGLSATTFHRHLNHFEASFPKVTVLNDKRFVDNGKIITSAGLSSGIDAALYLVSKIRGLEQAKTIAMHLEYDWQVDQGFVRATMADKHYPSNNYKWSDDTHFSNFISYGDKERWYRSYQVTTQDTAKELEAIYAKAISVHSDWQRVTAASNSLKWHKTIAGEQWLLAFNVVLDDNGKAVKLVNTLTKSENSAKLAKAR